MRSTLVITPTSKELAEVYCFLRDEGIQQGDVLVAQRYDYLEWSNSSRISFCTASQLELACRGAVYDEIAILKGTFMQTPLLVGLSCRKVTSFALDHSSTPCANAFCEACYA